MSVTVSEILLAAQGALAAVSPETAGYLVLGAADCLGEGRLGLKSVYLDEGGALRVERRGEPGGVDPEASLRSLLKRLLDTGRSPAPALLRVATTQESRGIPRLITEIEAALIPVNRAAARRALARLHRDVSRARSTHQLFDEPAANLLEPAPSNPAPPVALRAPEPSVHEPAPLDVVDRSTEGPTPIIPVVEEAHPVPASLTTVAPDATPFLGTVATAPAAISPAERAAHDSPFPVPAAVAEGPEGDVDTDPAPPVDFEASAPAPAEERAAATIVLGTYDVAASVEPEPFEPEPAQVSPAPGEASLYVAIPVVALRDPAPFVELDDLLDDSADAVLDDPEERDAPAERAEAPVDDVAASAGAPVDDVATSAAEQAEERDALEMLLFDASGPQDAVAETFTSMFELAPDGTVQPPEVADDDALFEALPPLVFTLGQQRDPDAIAEELGLDVPATPLAAASESEEPPQETSFGHLAEALIDEALAVAPRPLSVPPEIPAPLRAPPVAHTETVPGLGFVNVAPVPDEQPEEPSLSGEDAVAVAAPAAAADLDADDGCPPAPELDADADAGCPPMGEPDTRVAVAAPPAAHWDEEPFYDYESETPPGAEFGASSVASTYQPRRSDVAELVAAFVVAESRTLAELARELKRIAGISATPAPGGAVSERRRKASSAR